ncbi:hypothetical protein HY947_02085 [Candidatus Gottesmanbacteria bacterium]|nr:hypothetical protein [Candidatus Gottesmanbacteria bacterium]
MIDQEFVEIMLNVRTSSFHSSDTYGKLMIYGFFHTNYGIYMLYKGNKLREITGTFHEKAMVSSNLIFIFLLQQIFTSYPEIEKQFPPGALGLMINDSPPTDFSLLENDDVVTIIGEEVGLKAL